MTAWPYIGGDRTKMINLRLNFKYTGAWKIIVSSIISIRSNNVSEGSFSEVEHYSNMAAYYNVAAVGNTVGVHLILEIFPKKKTCLISRFHF